MPPVRTRTTRLLSISGSGIANHTLSAEALASPSIPPTPLIYDGQLVLSPESSLQNMTFSDSGGLGGAIYVGIPGSSSHTQPIEVINHTIPHAPDVHGYRILQSPTESPLIPTPTDNLPFGPIPRMSRYMRDVQKTQWDVRFPHPRSELDHCPALIDGRVLSFIIHSPRLQEDFIVERDISEPEFTVEDIYESLYQMLCNSLSSTDALYASRNDDERARIEDATQHRISGSSAKISPWRGQVRDILGSHCVVGQIIEDFTMGSWRIDFIEGCN